MFADTTCSSKEVALNWNQQGEQGLQREQGDDGVFSTSNISVVSATVTSGKTASVTCPAGAVATGGGGATSGNLSDSRPTFSVAAPTVPSGWTVTSSANNPTAWVVCASAS